MLRAGREQGADAALGGVKWITFHDLRATGITWMAVRGDDPLKIKQRAGHASLSTTEGYIRLAEELRERATHVRKPRRARR